MGESRRGFLKRLGGAAGVMGTTGCYAPQLYMDVTDDDFQQYVDEWYPEQADDVDDMFADDTLHLGIETWSVGDATIDDTTKQAVADIYAAEDIELHWFERDFPDDEFFADYSNDVDDTIYGRDSFYGQAVPDVAKRYLTQAIVLPTDNVTSTGIDCMMNSNCTHGGYGSNQGHRHRFVVTDRNSPGLIIHENGHAHGLSHPGRPNGYVMTRDGEWEHTTYSPSNWERFKEELQAYPYNQ